MTALVNAWLSPFFCDACVEHLLTKTEIKSQLVILRRAGSPCRPKKVVLKKVVLKKVVLKKDVLKSPPKKALLVRVSLF